MSSRILVIEDDLLVRSNIVDLLEAEGLQSLAADGGEAGLALARQQLPDLIICDVSMSGLDGYEVFAQLSAQPATAAIPFIFLSARAERSDVRRGMVLGADDYITKPFTRHELLDAIQTRLRRRGSSRPAPGARAPAAASGMIVSDPLMKELMAQLERAARSTISVLLLGETGVGKEVLAHELHVRSRRSGRFVAVNCAALTESLLESELFGHEKGAFTGADRAREGLFEAAEGGTLFLDEIGELAAATQVKLLRVLEDRKVMRVGGRTARAIDVRFVAATHRDLEREAESGSFRMDLFYRLNGIILQVPPLRARRSDIAALARQFVGRSQGSVQLAAATLEVLERYPWPGNIRELRNVVERALVLCDGAEILPQHLPGKLLQPAAASAGGAFEDPRTELAQRMAELERERIVAALERCAGNQTQAAELLGMSRRTLVSRLGHFALPRPRKSRGQAL